MRIPFYGGSKQFSIFHYNWTLWKVYSFVVKDYYYLLIADVAITFQLNNSCTLTDTLVVMATWQALKYTLFLVFSCILHKVVGKLPFLLHQNCLHIKEHFLRKFKKILSRGFGATLILQNIKVAPKPLNRIFLNFLKKCSLMCKHIWCNKKGSSPTTFCVKCSWILQNIKVAPKPLNRIFLNFLKKCSLMCKHIWCNKKGSSPTTFCVKCNRMVNIGCIWASV